MGTFVEPNHTQTIAVSKPKVGKKNSTCNKNKKNLTEKFN
jgi:hypothetical protein